MAREHAEWEGQHRDELNSEGHHWRQGEPSGCRRPGDEEWDVGMMFSS